jgi:hemerythrin superfamily protein
MDALDLIKQDHKRLRKLLEETLEAEGSEREQRMDFLRTELVAHERMEEEVLYPRLREEKKATRDGARRVRRTPRRRRASR